MKVLSGSLFYSAHNLNNCFSTSFKKYFLWRRLLNFKDVVRISLPAGAAPPISGCHFRQGIPLRIHS